MTRDDEAAKRAAMTRLVSRYASKLIVDWSPNLNRSPATATVDDVIERLKRCARPPRVEMREAVRDEARRQYVAGEAAPWWHGEPEFTPRQLSLLPGACED